MLQRKFGWEGESLGRVLAALRNGATLLDPDRIPLVIEGNEADNRILASRWKRPPTTWSPETDGISCPWGESRECGSSTLRCS